MPDQEFDSKFDQMCWNVSGVHNLQDLGKLFESEMRREWNIFELPLWRFVFMEDYTTDSSYCIFYFNHALMDGINAAAICKILSDGSDTKGIRYNSSVKKSNSLL